MPSFAVLLKDCFDRLLSGTLFEFAQYWIALCCVYGMTCVSRAKTLTIVRRRTHSTGDPLMRRPSKSHTKISATKKVPPRKLR